MHILLKRISTVGRRPSLFAIGMVFGLSLVASMAAGYVPQEYAFGVKSQVAAQEPEGTCSNEAGDPNPCALAERKITSTCPKGDCIIQKYIQPALNLAAALVGLAVTISFITAGIRYASSADNPQKVSEAKQRMVTSAMVLVGFFTFYALMNYLIPGGLL